MRAELAARREQGRSLPLLVWRFSRDVHVVSTASAGGGLGRRRWVVNAHVPDDYARHDLDDHLAELADELGLDGPGVGMLTAADVRRVHRAQAGGVVVEVTCGLTDPTWAADHPAARTAAPEPGTINIVGQLPVRLTDAALCNALCTATEAKAQALARAAVPGTGTPSDALTLICAYDRPSDRFGGPRSRWGAPLARAVYDAVLAGARTWQESAR